MAISPANRAFFFASQNTIFKAAYASTMLSTWANKIAATIPMDTETEYFGWTGSIKRAREWKGERVYDEPAPRTYAITAKVYEKSAKIDMFQVADDKFGLFSDLNQRVTGQLTKEPDYQLRDLIFNLGDQTGALQTSLDGVNHWATTHPVNFYDASYGTYNNDYRGAAGVGGIGGPLAYASLGNVRQDMLARKSESGEAFGVVPDLVVTGALLDLTARTLLQAEYLSPLAAYGATDNVGMVNNVNRNITDLFVNPDFPASTLSWLMLATKMGNMPFTVAMREAMQFAALVSPTDPIVVNEHKYAAVAHSRWAVGWGHPILSSISGPTAGA